MNAELRPTTVWRRACFRAAAWRFLTGITMMDSSTVRSPTMTGDTVADFKRASMALTPGERPMPPMPQHLPRYEPDLRHRLWLRRQRRKMEQDSIVLLAWGARYLRHHGLEVQARAKELEASVRQQLLDRVPRP